MTRQQRIQKIYAVVELVQLPFGLACLTEIKSAWDSNWPKTISHWVEFAVAVAYMLTMHLIVPILLHNQR